MATDREPDYSDYMDNNEYAAGSITFSPGVMKGLYDLTRSLIDNLLPANFLDTDTIKWDTDGTPALNIGYYDLVKQYSGLVTFFVFILLLLLLVPLSGLIFAFLRCCGLCGAKARVSDKKKDLCVKIILGTLLILCTGVLLFGVVSAFSSTEHMQTGTKQIPESVGKVYKDSINYVDSTEKQANLLFVTNYNEFRDTFTGIISDSGKTLLDEMPLWDNISIITNISEFVNKIPGIETKLKDLSGMTTNLQTQYGPLKTGMETIVTTLNGILTDCNLGDCKRFAGTIENLKINIDLTNMPAVPNIFNGLDISTISTSINDALSQIDTLKNNIDKQIQPVLDTANTELDKAGDLIQDNLKTLKDVIATAKTQMSDFNSSLEKSYDYLDAYYPYFYYVGITVSCLLLIVLGFLFFGLVFGSFGNRPDKYKSYCCSKGKGSVCLMSAAVMIFIITAIICLLTLVMSVVGLVADRGICYPLRNPDKSTVIQIVDEYVQKNYKTNIDFTISSILEKCYQNESIYNVLNLKTQFDIDETINKIKESSNIRDISKKVQDNLNEIFPKEFVVLSQEDENILKKLAESGTLDTKPFTDILSQDVIGEDLDIVANSIDDLANKIVGPDSKSASKLNEEAKNLRTYNNDVVKPFRDEVTKTLDLVKQLDDDLKMGSKSFPDAINDLINLIESAQTALQNNRNYITEAATKFTDMVVSLIMGYANRVQTVVKNKLGQCGPLNVAINAALIVVCDKIALPWNGFWVSLFICLIIFVPILIISIWLASVYKSYKADGQYFNMDREHRSKKNKKGQDTNDYYNLPSRNNGNSFPLGGNGYNDDNSNHYNPSAPNSNRNTRYYDMAPKFNRQQEASTRF